MNRKMSPPIVNKNDTRKNLNHGFEAEDIFVKNFYEEFSKNININIRKCIRNNNFKFDNIKFFYEVPVSNYGVSDLVIITWEGNKDDFPKLKNKKNITNFIENYNPTIFAFEMKLKGISKCISQSFSYKFYSHFSFAVMPQSFKKNIQKRTDYKKLNIGVLTMDDNNGIHVIYKPKKEEPFFKDNTPKIIKRLAIA